MSKQMVPRLVTEETIEWWVDGDSFPRMRFNLVTSSIETGNGAGPLITFTASGGGLPAGGSTTQALLKHSNTDQDATWQTLSKTMIGLTNVDDTADADKPISTAVASALAAKADSSTMTTALGGKADASTTTAALGLKADASTTTSALAAKAPLASPVFTGTPQLPAGTQMTTPSGLVKGDVGLGNVDNVADASKPVSTAQSSAITAAVTAGKINPKLFAINFNRDLSVPTSLWTPVPLDFNEVDSDGMHVLNTANTTIASGSNAATLPTGTIALADTTGIPASGYVTATGPTLVITGITTGASNGAALTGGNVFNKTSHGMANGTKVTISGLSNTGGVTNFSSYFVVSTATNTFKLSLTSGGAAITLTGTADITINVWSATTDVLVKYTGRSTSSGAGNLTGCTLGSGTLLTGMVVRVANIDVTIVTPYMYVAAGCATWGPSGNTTGSYQIRIVSGSFAVGANHTANTNEALSVGCQGQPAGAAGVATHLEVWQSTGSAQLLLHDVLQAPSLGMVWVSSQ